MSIVNMTDVNTIADNSTMETRHERLRAARKGAGFASARSAAMRFGWSPSTYAAHENGQNDFDFETASKYARSFNVNVFGLFVGRAEGGTKIETAPLAGAISTIDKVESYFNPRRGFEIPIKVSIPVDPDHYLYVIEDNSLWPKFEAEELAVVGKTNYGLNTYTLLKVYHVLETEVGLIFRRPEPTGKEQHFDLHSHAAPTVRNVRVLKAWSLTATFSRFSWFRTDFSSS